jgi:hypothetical protein
MAAMHRLLEAPTDRRSVELTRCGGPARAVRAALAAILLVLVAGALLCRAGIGGIAATALAAGMVYAWAADPVRGTRRGPAAVQPSPAGAVVAPLAPEGGAAPLDGAGVAAQARVADATPPLSCVERRMSDAAMRGVAARIAADAGRARAREALRHELGNLDGRCWLVECDMRLAGATIPFVLFGPYGVLVLSASEAWTMRDVSVVRWAADDLAASLADYPHPVRSGIYVPGHEGEPRWWCNDRGDTAWIFGDGWLPWLLAEFGDLGLSAADIAALRALAAAAAPPGRVRLPSHPASG